MKKNKMKICLSAAALVLAMSVMIGTAMAYFTTYAVAEGGVTIDLGFTDTETEEEVIDSKKQIVLKNTGDYDCYVRLKALTGNAHKDGIVYSEPEGAGLWTPGADGYYYYNGIVEAGGSTSQIDVSFVLPTENQTDFNVIIIQECTPVLLDENGEVYADWSVKADISQSIYEGEDE